MDFETKLAAAGETLEKLAAERGLSLNDFTEQETVDLLTTIMGESPKLAEEHAPEEEDEEHRKEKKMEKKEAHVSQLTYGQVMHEVAKVAAANGYDISQASPAELDDAVQKMAALLSNPEYLTKQAALQEKIAEADAMGRVMAHAYVDELGKLAAEAHEGDEEEKKEEEEKAEKEKAEKKASLYRSVKSAGEMPAALKEHFEKKDKEEEKKASFAKAASLRAAELLILNGINPETGAKFASDQEALDAGAALVLQSKGYL